VYEKERYIWRKSNMNIERNLRLRRGDVDKRLTSIGIVCLLVITGLLGFITFKSNVASAVIIYVGSGPGNQTDSIQDAIDNYANNSDTVYVHSGIYFENVWVDKTINLIGEDRTTTIIDGGGGGGIVSIWAADWVNISGFTVTNGQSGIQLLSVHNCRVFNNLAFTYDLHGIYLSHSRDNNITGNTVSNNHEGIRLDGSSWNNITGNEASNNDYGIHLTGSSWNNITDNIVHSNREEGIVLLSSTNNNLINNNASSNGGIGIRLEQSSENTLADNIMTNNGIWIRGSELEHWNTHDIDTSNTVNGKPVYYWKNQTGGKVPAGAGEVILANCTNVRVEGQELTLGTIGIELGFSSNNYIEDNNISSNHVGSIYLYSSKENIINNNNASSNLGIGINLESSNRNNVIGNNVSNNMRGIWLVVNSSGNDIIGNRVSSNLWGFYLNFDSENNNIIGNNISNNLIGIWLMQKTSNNLMYHNRILNNTNQAIDETNNSNQWDNGYPSGGNFWSDFDEPSEGAYDDYQGIDQNFFGSDGIVDNGTIAGGGKNPYVIDADSQDIYPLINPIDTSPPIITNLQPPDASITNDNTSTIGADYSDPSGINVSSVVLIVDGLDVTSFATATASGVSYTPGTVLSDGIHTVYLEVKDNYDNVATEIWSFTVDTSPPIITNLQPPDSSTSNDNIPTISADYSDPSGINVSSIILKVDGIDVTLSATVTANGVSYTPITTLSDGIHTVYLEVRDTVGNLATATWSFTVVTALPPATNLTVKVVNNGNNVELEWDPPSPLALDHYLIYRADSATEFDFTTPHNISTTWPTPKSFTWIDPDPNVTAVDDDFYYIIRAANFDESIVSLTSNTAGVWTRTFQDGISTFSLPLEPFVKKDSEVYCQNMNASYIKWMNQTTHTWMRHDKGSSENNTLVEVGKGYEIGFLGKSTQTKYTFTGFPGAMILYDSVPFGFDATPLTGDADSLTAKVDNNGNITLNWTKPTNIGSGDRYYVLRSTSRDGFWGTEGINYTQLAALPFDVLSYQDIGNATTGTEYYYMIVPVNFTTGEGGVSSYSIGVWTAGYLDQYDTFALPLKLSNYQTTDWYCDKISDTIGINYYIYGEQRWGWHSKRMPAGAYDPILVMAEGYQISTSGLTKFTFIGI
jgi:parallel beta-helix repeat protein